MDNLTSNDSIRSLLVGINRFSGALVSDYGKQFSVVRDDRGYYAVTSGKILKFSYILIRKPYIQSKNSPANWNKYF